MIIPAICRAEGKFDLLKTLGCIDKWVDFGE
jgi:hypothetical protein